jgi:hypothetical protein
MRYREQLLAIQLNTKAFAPLSLVQLLAVRNS